MLPARQAETGVSSIVVGPDGLEVVTLAIDGGEEGWRDDEGYWAMCQDGEWNLNPLPFPYRFGLRVMFHPYGYPVLVTPVYATYSPSGYLAMYW